MYLLQTLALGYQENDAHSVGLLKRVECYITGSPFLGRRESPSDTQERQFLATENLAEGLTTLLDEAKREVVQRFGDEALAYLGDFYAVIRTADNDAGRFWQGEGDTRRYNLATGRMI